MKGIIEIQLRNLRRLMAERKITLELTDSAKERIIEEGYDPVYGARPLKRVIQRRVQDPLAPKILMREVRDGDHVVIDADGERLSFAVVVPDSAQASEAV
jgi:ATP-dependent Clp protease ATP-binding subunit ClpB